MNDTYDFIKLESLGAKLLLGATVLALFWSNSPWFTLYDTLFHHTFVLHLRQFQFKTNMLFFINEILMTIFFLVVSLEIKYELIAGALNTKEKAALPFFAALGGMIAPAFIYILFNFFNKDYLRGWAIPTATDIAFALGVLSLLGTLVKPQLKAFLTALAIIDDLIAISIIAVFYSAHLSLGYLGFVLIFMLILFVMNQSNVKNLFFYCFIGILLWFSLLFSGIHPTLAGVVLAAFIPLPSAQQLKNKIHIFVVLLILPLFAFANAGVSFFQLSYQSLHFSVLIGIALSLFLGKQLGVFSASWLAVKSRLAHLPKDVQWKELYGVAIICGIGFTISLFIGGLAFSELSFVNSVKIGVLLGSVVSGVVGYFFLKQTN